MILETKRGSDVKKASLSGLNRGKIPILVTALALVVVFYSIFIIYPIVLVFVGSFFDWNPLIHKFNFLGSMNYSELISDSLFWLSLRNTLFFTIVTITVRTSIGFLLAVLIFKVRYLKAYFRLAYFMPVITSLVAVSLVWQWMFDPKIGVFNTVLGFFGLPALMWLKSSSLALISIMMMTVWKDIGFALVLYLGGLSTVPREYYESAEIDGTNGWQAFWKITFPLLKPTTLLVMVTGVIGYMQVFTQIFMMTKGGPVTASYTIVYHVYFEAFSKFRFGYASAISCVLCIIIAILSLIQFKLMKTDWRY